MPAYSSENGHLDADLRARPAVQLAVALVRGDQQDLLECVDLAIDRSLTRRPWPSVPGDRISTVRNGALTACRPGSFAAQVAAMSASK
jgi:hypothetical protein